MPTAYESGVYVLADIVLCFTKAALAPVLYNAQARWGIDRGPRIGAARAKLTYYARWDACIRLVLHKQLPPAMEY